MTYFGSAVSIKDGANLDAFSRVRVSNPSIQFDVQCQYDASPLKMEVGATGTGVTPTHDANTRMVTVSATAGSGTSFIQSYEYIPYQPGRSQLIFMTGVIGAAVAGAVVDFGYFDAANGVYFCQNGTSGLQFVRRTSTSGSVVDNAVAQASWNIDPLDGTGPSGITLDVTKAFILVIDGQFLGMGRVRCGFDIDGEIVYAHEFLNANVLTVPYSQTLSLPVQCLITATAIGSTKTASFKCASVTSEGGEFDAGGYTFATPEQTVTAASGARTHILSMRPRTTFNSKTNRYHLHLRDINILVTGINPVRWELCIGSTFSAGPTWANVDGTYSASEYTSAVGTLNTAGLVIASGYIASSATSKGYATAAIGDVYPITLDRAGAQRAFGTMSLLVTGIGGTSATRASFDFTEIR